MGLLNYLSTHTLDEDYAYVARRKGSGSSGSEPPRRLGVVAGVVMALFATLVVTAGVQTSKSSVSDERERQELLTRVEDARDQLAVNRRDLRSLQLATRQLETSLLSNDDQAKHLVARIDLLGRRAGTAAVHGPGVVVTVDDAANAQEDRDRVLDSDLQRLVNGLWEAGAEAISINGERLTTLSAIRVGGTAITVNFRSLSRPYVVSVIGDPDTLPARFVETTSGQAWLDLRQEVGLKFAMRTVRDVRLPGATMPTLRYAHSIPKGGNS